MNEPDISKELEKMEYEPILPVEMKLIGWSLALGVSSLALLIFLSR